MARQGQGEKAFVLKTAELQLLGTNCKNTDVYIKEAEH